MYEESIRPLQDLQEILLEAQSDIGQGFFVHEDGRLLYANGANSRVAGALQISQVGHCHWSRIRWCPPWCVIPHLEMGGTGDSPSGDPRLRSLTT